MQYEPCGPINIHYVNNHSLLNSIVGEIYFFNFQLVYGKFYYYPHNMYEDKNTINMLWTRWICTTCEFFSCVMAHESKWGLFVDTCVMIDLFLMSMGEGGGHSLYILSTPYIWII